MIVSNSGARYEYVQAPAGNMICMLTAAYMSADLSRDYRGDPLLKTSFFLKLTIIVLGVCALISIAVIAGICNHRTPPGGETNQYCNRPVRFRLQRCCQSVPLQPVSVKEQNCFAASCQLCHVTSIATANEPLPQA